jgi:acyl carrier protein
MDAAANFTLWGDAGVLLLSPRKFADRRIGKENPLEFAIERFAGLRSVLAAAVITACFVTQPTAAQPFPVSCFAVSAFKTAQRCGLDAADVIEVNAGAEQKENIARRVKKIVVEHLRVKAEKVVDGANFKNDLGADDIDEVELIMKFEGEFGVEIPDDAAKKIRTVGDAVKFLKKAMAK